MADGKEHRKNTAGLKPPWKKGQSGNPKGRPKGPSLVDALKKVLQEMGEEETLKKLARAWVGQSAKGNAVFFKELIERLDGKVAQKTELSGAEGGPVEVRKWSTAEVWAAYESALRDAEKRDAD